MVFLHVTYSVAAHEVETFERLFLDEFLPVILEHGFDLHGFWKTLVGPAGEFTELWRFDSAEHYERAWRALNADPRVTGILRRTGPMVHGERFKLLDPVEVG